MSKFLHKVIIDWRDTPSENLHYDGIDARFFSDKTEARAFILGFQAGISTSSKYNKPLVILESVEDKLWKENK